MSVIYLTMASAIMLSFAGGAVRLLRGPSRADRMMGAQLFGTTGAAILMVLAVVMEAWILIDVALVFAVLAAVTVIAFVQRSEISPGEGNSDSESEEERARR